MNNAYAELYITDGTTKVNLLPRGTGIQVSNWRPKVAQAKGGGVWNDPVTRDGRQLSMRKLSNVIEEMTLDIVGMNPDGLRKVKDPLIDMLNKAVTYWTTPWQTGPVWLVVRPTGAEKSSYAAICDYSISDEDNPIQGMRFPITGISVDGNYSLFIERLPCWWSAPLDDPACQEIYASMQACDTWMLTFNGVDQEINCPAGVNINDMPSTYPGWSVECYFYTNDYGSTVAATVNGVIAEKADAWIMTEGWRIMTDSAVSGISAEIVYSVTNAYSSIAFDAINDNDIHHLVVYLDNKDNKIYMAIDGEWASAYGTQTAGNGVYQVDNADDMIIGASVANQAYFDGAIGWLRCNGDNRYDPSYDFEPEPKCPLPYSYIPALWIGIYEGVGTTIKDLTGISNGTAVNDAWEEPCCITAGNVMPYEEYEPAANADDGYDSGAVFTSANTQLIIGDIAGTTYDSAIRFRDVQVPFGTQIEYAAVVFQCSTSNNVNEVNALIKVEETASPDAYSTHANFLARDWSTEAIFWGDIEDMVAGELYRTPNIKSLIQIIVNLSEWGSGDDISIRFQEDGSDNNARRYLAAYDHATYDPPKLIIQHRDEEGNLHETTCEHGVYVGNKLNEARLSHVLMEDGGVLTGNLLRTTPPYQILPAATAANDRVYFGVESGTLNGGPFDSLVLNIGTAAGAATACVWEYWNGGWAALTVQDNTNADGLMTGVAFDTTGIRSVHWVPPSDWTTTSVGGVTAYWVRAECQAVSTGATIAEDQPYTISWPYIEIDAEDVRGTDPAFARWQLRNESDNNFSGAVLTPCNHFYAGIRSVSRGSDFAAFLNAGREQMPLGVTFTGTGAYATDPAFPTGEKCTVSNVPAAWTSLGEWDIDSSVAQQYGGVYRCFFRCAQSGAIGDAEYRLTISYYSGMSFLRYGPEVIKYAQNLTLSWVDFGRITIAAGEFLGPDSMNQIEIDISAYGDGAVDVHPCDLILIPADEWLLSTSETVDTAYGTGGRRQTLLNTYLDVDAISVPKALKRVLVKFQTDDTIMTMPPPSMSGPPILQASADQRLWIFTGITNSSGNTISYPLATHSVRSWSQERHLILRGSE